MQVERNFDGVTILLHWLMAVLLFFLFGLGLYMVELSYYDVWYKDATELHKSLGLVFSVLLITRISWRLWVTRNDRKEALGEMIWEQVLARYVQRSMYLFMLILCLSGYMISTAGDRTVSFFNLFELPSLWFELEQQEEVAGQVHLYIAWGLVGLVGLHLIGALKHHFLDRDRVLISILKVTQKNGDN